MKNDIFFFQLKIHCSSRPNRICIICELLNTERGKIIYHLAIITLKIFFFCQQVFRTNDKTIINQNCVTFNF